MQYLLSTVAFLVVATGAHAASPTLTVYKDPNCGCCEEWVKHVNQAGIRTKVINSSDMTAMKTKLGVPAQFGSCHTAVIDGSAQVVEGHVPATAVRKLAAHPTLKGVAVPGMPANSPGMGRMDGNLVTVDFSGKPFSKD
ncbi:protein involved in copper detoxification [Cupriavidus necator]|uniref:Protein involved in copper detoxification n=1 Tax=Cupriavidus necator TaxID=106590 RepID=A0A1K0IBQ4_CUPNE|nr:protein involved in copper detoxification [Cupriavidus necator]